MRFIGDFVAELQFHFFYNWFSFFFSNSFQIEISILHFNAMYLIFTYVFLSLFHFQIESRYIVVVEDEKQIEHTF